MNSYQLRYYLNTLGSGVHTGVYAIDQLQYVKAKHFAIIFNNMDSSSNGMHWCCLVKLPNQKSIDFFDSLGMKVKFYGKQLEIFIKQHGGIVKYCSKNM